MQTKQHWENVYTSKSPDRVSWYQAHADASMRLIRNTGVPVSASLVDVGGGASTLVDDLLKSGYESLTVLDVSSAALAAARRRLGGRAEAVRWLEADVTEAELPDRTFAVWHDRAVFHFLTAPEQRRAYLDTLLHSVEPGGHVIVATFADDGPTRCSGLPVMRYSAAELQAELGDRFTMVEQLKEPHRTPFDTVQNFVYCRFRLESE